MGSQVIRQMCQLFEAPPTFVALMWLLSCVSIPMNLHVNLLVESLSAEVANERLVVSVRAHMSVQVRRAVEGLVTLPAHVRFHCGVRQAMTSQVPRLSEGAATLLADEWLVSSVDPFVGCQSVRAAKRFVAHITRVAIYFA